MNLTVAFSYVRKIKDGLDRAHLRELGRPSNVEMNLRKMLERFDIKTLKEMQAKMKEREGKLKKEYDEMLAENPKLGLSI